MKKNDSREHCYYCERKFNIAHYGTNKPCAQTRDHIIPVSKGGHGRESNMVYSCIECNNWKSSFSLLEFAALVQSFIDAGKKYKTIPETRLHLIVKKATELNLYVIDRGDSLYLPPTEKAIPLFDVPAKLPTIAEINKAAKRQRNKLKEYPLQLTDKSGKPIVYIGEHEAEWQTMYLQCQTPEQFKLAKKHGWKVAHALTEPEQNFHE